MNSKGYWLFILDFLESKIQSEKVLNVSKQLISAMVKGTGLREPVNKTLLGLISGLKSTGLNMTEDNIQSALLWGRYALHTEAQVEVLKAVNNIQIIFANDPPKEAIMAICGDCYSLYNPCCSCQYLKWVELRLEGKLNERFLYCLGNNTRPPMERTLSKVFLFTKSNEKYCCFYRLVETFQNLNVCYFIVLF